MSRRASRVLFGAALGAAGVLLWQLTEPAPSSRPVLVYCGAAMRAPVEAAAQAYERETGGRVELQYGGSQTLLASLELSKTGDLYLPGDDGYLDKARAKSLLDETLPLGGMTAVLAVKKGNPKKVAALEDLLREDVRVVQANPEAAAIGKLVQGLLTKAGRWEPLKAKTLVFKPTVHEVGNDLKLGAADAGFLWDAVLGQYPDLEAVALPELKGAEASISVAVLRSTADAAGALRFARWLAARDRGLPEFRRAGFRVVEGDAWAVVPRLTLHVGAMLRPAIEETLVDFERREGCEVTRVYNGCGILVAQQKAGDRPDAYFACEASFMTQVKDYYGPSTELSSNQLVIVVKKGNPHGVKKLKDLGKPGLRVGVGHEQQCALGAITQETLKVDGTLAAVMKNVVVQTPTGDMLVNQLKAGGLDAAVVYVSNAATSGDVLEAHPVDLPCAIASQPMAVGKASAQAGLARRLLAALASDRSRERFLAEGFRWKVDVGASPQR